MTQNDIENKIYSQKTNSYIKEDNISITDNISDTTFSVEQKHFDGNHPTAHHSLPNFLKQENPSQRRGEPLVNANESPNCLQTKVDYPSSSLPSFQSATATTHTVQIDQPPHPDDRLTDLFTLINEAERQAQQAAEAAQNAGMAARAHISKTSGSATDVHTALQASTFSAAKNAVEAAKAALKAQSSALEASAAAISQSMQELNRKKELLQQKDAVILDLRKGTEQAQQTATQALESFYSAKAAAEQEAAKAQEQQQNLNQAIQEKEQIERQMREAQENLNYVYARARTARETFLNLQNLSKSTETELANLVQHTAEEAKPAGFPPPNNQSISSTKDAQDKPSKTDSEADATTTTGQSQQSQESGFTSEQADAGNDTDFSTAAPHKDAAAKTKKKPKVKDILWSYAKVILLAFIFAFLLRTFVFEITQVQGPSMLPTLSTGDRLITSKLAYTFGDPQRGDIVVLSAPDAENQYYIKRIIGLPNERLTISNGQVYIDGIQLEEPYLTQLLTEGDIDVMIPGGYYFVMGDNREDSRDSRVDSIGLIHEDALSGKAIFRIFPGSKIGSIYR